MRSPRSSDVPATRLNDIVRGRLGVTADTALRLARYLGTTAQFWLNFQSAYERGLLNDGKGQRSRRPWPSKGRLKPSSRARSRLTLGRCEIQIASSRARVLVRLLSLELLRKIWQPIRTGKRI
jgi:hypothetical protein